MSNQVINNGFTQIPNRIVLNGKLSFKARGILVLMMSRPPNWKFNVAELTSKSEKDGKSSVRNGLKELRDAGYVELKKVYNKETRQLDGTRYFLKENLKCARRTNFQEVEKLEGQKSCVQEKVKVRKLEGQKWPTHNNTDNSNKEFNNTHQQQNAQSSKQKTVVAALKISSFKDELLKDTQWQHSFIGKTIGEGTFLKIEQVEILLNHFIKSSLQADTDYDNTGAAKKHFVNWFNLHHSKRNLSPFIRQGRQESQKRIERINTIRKEVAHILTRLKSKTCKDIQTVLNFKKILQQHSNALNNLSKFGLEIAVQNALAEELPIISDYIDIVSRGESKNQLAWFCESFHNSS